MKKNGIDFQKTPVSVHYPSHPAILKHHLEQLLPELVVRGELGSLGLVQPEPVLSEKTGFKLAQVNCLNSPYM